MRRLLPLLVALLAAWLGQADAGHAARGTAALRSGLRLPGPPPASCGDDHDDRAWSAAVHSNHQRLMRRLPLVARRAGAPGRDYAVGWLQLRRVRTTCAHRRCRGYGSEAPRGDSRASFIAPRRDASPQKRERALVRAVRSVVRTSRGRSPVAGRSVSGLSGLPGKTRNLAPEVDGFARPAVPK